MATSHLMRTANENENAYFNAIHTVRAVRNKDMAYTSASDALYHAESHHAKQSEPETEATDMAAFLQGERPFQTRRIREIETEQSIITDKAVKRPDIIFTTLT